MNRRNEIDGLRGLAVLFVILFHSGREVFSGGFIGVDVFFVVSGYLTANLVFNSRNESFSFLRFAESRARRLLPVFYFIIFISLLIAYFVMLPNEIVEFSRQGIRSILFFSNLYFSELNNYFDSSSDYSALIHTWSLSIEIQFYIFLIVIYYLSRFFLKFHLSKFFILTIIFSFIFSIAAPLYFSASSFYFFTARIWEFAVGVSIVFIRTDLFLLKFKSNKVSIVLSAFGLFLILYSGFNLGGMNLQSPFYVLLPSLGAFLVLLFTNTTDAISRLLSTKFFVLLGLISYSLYLWHQPVFVFFRIVNLELASYPVPVFIILLTILISYASWKYIEIPFRKNFVMLGRKFWFACAISNLVLLVTFNGIITEDAFKDRYTNVQKKLLDYTNPIHKNYVSARFNGLNYKNFVEENNKIKVLIVGDSYAQDLVNAIYESGLDDKYQISTRHILKECGNLFLPRESFASNVVESRPGSCGLTGLYEDSDFKKIVLHSDEIWFASSWQFWHLNFIYNSFESIKLFSGKKIMFFGRKNLGLINIRNYLYISDHSRVNLKLDVPVEQILINNKMKQELPAENFIDVQELLCGSVVSSCSPFLNNDTLKTFDGTHLTKSGAELYGNQLRKILHY